MISIIVPIYNVEKYLPRCIESLMAQTYQNLEIILVDDGSPDRCPQICDEYASRDSRIVVIHQPNAGVSSARNAGLSKAKGEYIGFCDPDDWAAPNMFEELLVALEQNDADLAICGYNYYDEQYQVDTKRLYAERETEAIDQKTLMDRLADMPPSIRHGVCNKLFCESLLHNLRFKEGLHSSEDVLFLMEYVGAIKKTVIVHKALYNNLVRDGSATHGGLSFHSLCDSIAVHEYMYNSVVEHYPELKDRAQAFLLDVCTLKYNAAREKLKDIAPRNQTLVWNDISTVRTTIKKHALKAILNKEIYWKTRIAYLLLK